MYSRRINGEGRWRGHLSVAGSCGKWPLKPGLLLCFYGVGWAFSPYKENCRETAGGAGLIQGCPGDLWPVIARPCVCVGAEGTWLVRADRVRLSAIPVATISCQTARLILLSMNVELNSTRPTNMTHRQRCTSYSTVLSCHIVIVR